jgi:sugar phosphate isomerase/epimerase
MNMFEQIGVALYNEFKASIESFLRFLKDMDVAYLEIGKEWIPTRREIGEIKDLLDIYELKATLHISDHYNLAESDTRRWKRNVLGVLGDLSVCYDLEVESAVLHCGWVSHPDELARGFAKFGEAYETIQDFAGDLGVKIYLENQCSEGVRHYIFEDHRSIDRFGEFVDLNGVSFALDVGHIGRMGVPLDVLASRMGDKLAEIHLHDYNELGQDHLPLGVGKLDMEALRRIIVDRMPLVVVENRSVRDVKKSISCFRAVCSTGFSPSERR